jgi:hypothetical protein
MCRSYYDEIDRTRAVARSLLNGNAPILCPICADMEGGWGSLYYYFPCGMAVRACHWETLFAAGVSVVRHGRATLEGLSIICSLGGTDRLETFAELARVLWKQAPDTVLTAELSLETDPICKADISRKIRIFRDLVRTELPMIPVLQTIVLDYLVI